MFFVGPSPLIDSLGQKIEFLFRYFPHTRSLFVQIFQFSASKPPTVYIQVYRKGFGPFLVDFRASAIEFRALVKLSIFELSTMR